MRPTRIGVGGVGHPPPGVRRVAEQAIDQAGDGLRQLSRLDSTSLQQTIDELQRLRPRLEATSQACREEMNSG